MANDLQLLSSQLTMLSILNIFKMANFVILDDVGQI